MLLLLVVYIVWSKLWQTNYRESYLVSTTRYCLYICRVNRKSKTSNLINTLNNVAFLFYFILFSKLELTNHSHDAQTLKLANNNKRNFFFKNKHNNGLIIFFIQIGNCCCCQFILFFLPAIIFYDKRQKWKKMLETKTLFFFKLHNLIFKIKTTKVGWLYLISIATNIRSFVFIVFNPGCLTKWRHMFLQF